MSKVDLDKLMDALMAIPAEEVKYPSIPVPYYIQEAVTQFKIVAEDKERLVAHGIDWQLAESIPERAAACAEAQGNWAKDFKAQEEAEKEWIKKSPAAFKLRDSILDAFRYAFRKDTALMAKVAVITEGTSREDMIQDLTDISILGKANVTLLEAVKFDVSKLDLASATSDEMRLLLAGAKGQNGNSKQLDIRNRAFTYLKQAVDEVRSCGKYAFADDDRVKRYSSEFLRKYRKKTGEAKEEPAS